ncbi:MAG TPA: tubulin-like doman-containing protein [Armatimonadota bacterium]|jgi:hypothetical protein
MPEHQAVPQKVRKMLVVGLGSTGTDICTIFAERLIQEFGGLDAAPWIRFLCVETNKAKEGLMKDRGEMMPITLNAQEFAAALQGPQALNEAIDLSGWADFSVLHGDGNGGGRPGLLNNIGDIESGAGNIRMAGRLAFLYPRNFTRFKQEFESRYNDLVALSEHDAAIARGPLPGGANPPIAFAGNDVNNIENANTNEIVVVVVGSLCGGTASGICVDVGYFIKHVAPASKRLAIFSLPRPDLVPTGNMYSNAERYKKNAHSALKELHHFSQVASNPYTVKYPVHRDALVMRQTYPYELITLAWPDNGFPEAEEKLQSTIAERLFINAFNTATDPFVQGVDAMAGREYSIHGQPRHTLFCTFGLSVLEYPAPRLVEFGATRLLEATLRPWAEKHAMQAEAAREVGEAGLGWDGMKRALLAHDNGVTHQLTAKSEAIVENAQRNPNGFVNDLNQLRLAFGEQTGGEPDANLRYNVVAETLGAGQNACVEQVWGSLSNRLRAALADWRKGPYYALDFVKEAQATLRRIQEAIPSITGGDPPRADATLLDLKRLKNDGYVHFLPPLYKKAAADASTGLLRDLNGYVANRVDRIIAATLAPSQDVSGIMRSGVLGQLEVRLSKVQRRLENLTMALTTYTNSLRQQRDRLAYPPRVNGVCLMEAGSAEKTYTQMLSPNGDAAGVTAAEQGLAPSILQAFAVSAGGITSVDQESEWDNAPRPDAGLAALPAVQRDALMGAARQPFQPLLSRNVVDEWNRQTDQTGLIRKFLDAADVSMHPDENKAQHLRNAPITHVDVLVYPRSGAVADAFAHAAEAGMAYTPEDAIEATRAIALRERYCIPPEALPGVVAVDGNPSALENAQFTTFSTFSRKDVVWGPMSERESQFMEECEELLAVAIVIGAAGVRGGMLEMKYPPKDFGDVDYRRFAPHFPNAVLKWALVGRDDENRELSRVKSTLGAAIQRKIQDIGGRDFVCLLKNAPQAVPVGLTGWDKENIGRMLMRFCQRDAVLSNFRDVFDRPDDNLLSILHYRQGQITVMGRPAPEEGFRCINFEKNDDSLLGRTEEEAAAKGWKCDVCGAVYAASDTADKSRWISAAIQRKGA